MKSFLGAGCSSTEKDQINLLTLSSYIHDAFTQWTRTKKQLKRNLSFFVLENSVQGHQPYHHSSISVILLQPNKQAIQAE